jgi:FkbM family methyltransferase
MNTTDSISQLQAGELQVEALLAARLHTRYMIDVGAHHGSTLLPFLNAGWRVIAFEPIADNRRVLLERCGPCERLLVRPEAVSSHSGTGVLQLALRLDGAPHDYYHSLEPTRADRYHRKGGVESVPLVSLDELAARGEVPHEVGFLKIDTEGHDLAVLRGAGRLRCDVVSVEFWGDRHPLGRSPSPAAEVVRLMAARDYPRYLVLSHLEEAVSVFDSTLEGVPPTAWGNLFFFHASQCDLHREMCVAVCDRRRAVASASTESRLLRLVGLVFPDRSALSVLGVPAVDNGLVNDLCAGFPTSRGVGFDPAMPPTGVVDLLHIRDAGRVGELLLGCATVLERDRPAVLVCVHAANASDGPDPFAKALALLRPAGYRLAGLFHMQTSPEGLIVAADLLFLTAAQYALARGGGAVVAAEDPEVLLEQTRILQQTCDERQAVIEELAQTAQERLALIDELDRACRESERTARRRAGLEDLVRSLEQANRALEARLSDGVAARVGRFLRRLRLRGRSAS